MNANVWFCAEVFVILVIQQKIRCHFILLLPLLRSKLA